MTQALSVVRRLTVEECERRSRRCIDFVELLICETDESSARSSLAAIPKFQRAAIDFQHAADLASDGDFSMLRRLESHFWPKSTVAKKRKGKLIKPPELFVDVDRHVWTEEERVTHREHLAAIEFRAEFRVVRDQ